jgi:hypothetical protein
MDKIYVVFMAIVFLLWCGILILSNLYFWQLHHAAISMIAMILIGLIGIGGAGYMVYLAVKDDS